MTVWPVFVLALFGSSPQAGGHECSTSARSVFQLVEAMVEVQPFRNEAEFKPFVDTLDAYCFRRSVAAWEFADADAKVIVAVNLERAMVALSLVPTSPENFGDAALAALIKRAEQVSASVGDSIDVRLPARSVAVGASTGRVTESLGFLLAGGRWYRTTVTVQWGAPGAGAR